MLEPIGLDLFTVFLSSVSILLVLDIILFISWKNHKKDFRGLGFWVIAYLMFSLSYFLYPQSVAFDTLLLNFVANLIMIGAMILMYAGTRMFLDLENNSVHHFAIFLLFFLILLIFTFFKPNVIVRIIAFSLLGSFFTIKELIIFVRSKDTDFLSASMIILSKGVIVLLLMLRIIPALNLLPHSSYQEIGNPDSLILLAVLTATTAYTIGYLLLISFRLQRKQENLISEKNQLLDDMSTRNRELEKAQAELKTLSGLLPICSKCKKIRDEEGYWNRIETYIEKRTEAHFSHSLCESCADELYGELDWYRKWKNE